MPIDWLSFWLGCITAALVLGVATTWVILAWRILLERRLKTPKEREVSSGR